MSQVIPRAKETSKLGSVPSVEARWKVRGVDVDGKSVIEPSEVRTCGSDGVRELLWYRELKVERVDSIEIDVEVDEHSGVQSLGWSSASPQSIVIAESEDTKYRALHRPPKSAENRRIVKFFVPRAQLGSHLLLSAHVVRGNALAGQFGGSIGQYLARTPHTERLKIRFDAPDWKEGGGLPILWTKFDVSEEELVWRWKGLPALSEPDPQIELEMNSAYESIQSLLQSRDNARKETRTAVAHFVAAEAMFELGVAAARQVDGHEIPPDTGIKAALDMIADRLQESASDLLEDLRDPTTAVEVMRRLRIKFGCGYNMNEFVDAATKRGGAQ